MKITDVKINGMKNPTGYSFDSARVSWKVTDSQGIAQKSAEIEVSLDREFKELLYKKNSADLNQTGEALEMKTEPRTRYFVRVTVTDDQDETAVSESVSFRDSQNAGILAGKRSRQSRNTNIIRFSSKSLKWKKKFRQPDYTSADLDFFRQN